VLSVGGGSVAGMADIGDGERGLDYIGSTERDTLRLAEAAEGNMTAEVAACPGWTVADLVWHLREVQWFWGTIVAGLLPEPPDEALRPERPSDHDRLLLDLRGGVATMAATFRAAEPAAGCWTWAPQKDVAFVLRHQAQEAAVHRWDAQAAAGPPQPLDAAIAADAVSEFLEFSTGWVIEGTAGLPGAVRLEATDTGGQWTVVEDAERTLRFHTGGGHVDAVTTVRGTASALLLGLYRRGGKEELQVAGDPAGWPALVGRNNLD
jgi:uncharacterized protein (TIGR03083 family)